MDHRVTAPAGRKEPWLSLLVALITSALVTQGCTSVPSGPAGYTEGVEQNDFPVPARFELVPGQSWSYTPPGTEAPAVRSWQGRYRGTGSLERLAPFYVREMPALGWKLSDIKDLGRNRKILSFYKGDEEAEVTLYREYDRKLARYGVVIQGDIRPRRLESFGFEGDVTPTSLPDTVFPPERPVTATDAAEVPGK